MSVGEIIYYSITGFLIVVCIVLFLLIQKREMAKEYDLLIDGAFYGCVHNVELDKKHHVVSFTDVLGGERSVAYSNLLMVSLPHGGDHE